MQKGVIEQKGEREAKNGSKYLTLVISGNNYSVWDTKLFGFCEVGNVVGFEFEEKGKFRNINTIVPEGQTKLSEEPTATNKEIQPADNDKVTGMRRMNALNNTMPMMTLLHASGHLTEKNPKEIMEIEAKLLSLHETYLAEGMMKISRRISLSLML